MMREQGTPVDTDAILADPSAAFAQPQDVLADQRFSRAIKLKILRQWEQDARGLAVAEGEGMLGGEESMLARVRHAIQNLEASASRYPSPSGGRLLDASAAQLRASYGGVVDAVEAAGCQVIRAAKKQPFAALMIAAGLGYLSGQLGHRR
jgi:hypothetical protein